MQQDEEEINTYHCDKEGYFWEDEPDSADILSDKSSHKNSYEINSDWSINPPYDQESIMEEMEASNIEVIETVDEEIIQ